MKITVDSNVLDPGHDGDDEQEQAEPAHLLS
jgi:hypothetical protein